MVLTQMSALGALGRVLLNENMQREMQDVFDLTYRDIPAADKQLRKMNGAAGEYDVFSVDTKHSISYWGNQFAQYAKRLAERRGRPVFVVSHSRGGDIARDAIQRAGADQYVDTLVELATPNNGTQPDVFEPLEVFKSRIRNRYVLDDIPPGNPYLRELDAAPEPKTKVYNLHTISEADWMVPHQSSHLDWTENIEYENVGHSRYLADPEVATFLAEIYPANTPVVYVHGLHDIMTIILEGTVLYPLPVAFAFPWLPVQERYIAQNGFKPIHRALAETGKMKAELRAVA